MAGFRAIGLDNDSVTYFNETINIYNGIINIKEPVFVGFAYITKYLFNEDAALIFVFYAFLGVFIKGYAIKKYSDRPFLSLLVYAGMFFILHEMTQIRVGLAAAFFLLAIPDLIEGKRKYYAIKIFLAMLCHFSAIILFPLIFLSSKKINFKILFFLPILALSIVIIVGDMNPVLISIFSYLPEPLATKGITYTVGAQKFGRFDNVNIFSKFTLSAFFFFIIYLVCAVKAKKITRDDILYLKLFSFMLTVFYLCSSVPVLASRSFELYAVSFVYSLPAITKFFKPKWTASAVIALWVLLYFYLVNLKLIGV